MAAITCLCPAKINLYLKVLGRRADGYHDLVTVMQPLTLADRLTVTQAAPGITLTCDDRDLPTGPGNLVWRAAQAYEVASGVSLAVHLQLRKKIPVAAGLGGGSSDAAGTLLAMNRLFKQRLDDPTLHRLAAGLGADVPFFLKPAPQIGKGTGTELTLVPLPAFWYVLWNPGFHVSTRSVYQGLDLKDLQNHTGSLPADLDQAPPRGWVGNDLETVTMRLFPKLRDFLGHLDAAGAEASGMSGSGPTLFGLFSGAETALAAARSLKERFGGWLAVARGLTGKERENAWGEQTWII